MDYDFMLPERCNISLSCKMPRCQTFQYYRTYLHPPSPGQQIKKLKVELSPLT